MKKCQLCGQEKKLIKSHIIPEFMYKELYNKEHRFYEFTKKDILEGKELKPFVQIGVFDKNILCSECDNERLGSLEKYGQKVLFGKNLDETETPKCDNYTTGDYEFSECKNVDYRKMKLFLLSILWRSSITNRPTFDSVNLGPHSDIIKSMILNSNPGVENEYPIIVTSFVRADYHYKDLILTPRRIKLKGGFNTYIFSIGSFQFHFFVNSPRHKLPEFVLELTLKENNSMKIIHLKDGMEKMLIKKLSE